MAHATKTQVRRARDEAGRDRNQRVRAVAAARRRRRRVLAVVGSSVGVLALVAGIVLAAAFRDGSTARPAAGDSRTPASASVLRSVAQVPQSTLAAVGVRAVTGWPKRIADAPLTQGEKPLILYVGAEYCPFCAAERWSLVQALSRFGTFHDLA